MTRRRKAQSRRRRPPSAQFSEALAEPPGERDTPRAADAQRTHRVRQVATFAQRAMSDRSKAADIGRAEVG